MSGTLREGEKSVSGYLNDLLYDHIRSVVNGHWLGFKVVSTDYATPMVIQHHDEFYEIKVVKKKWKMK